MAAFTPLAAKHLDATLPSLLAGPRGGPVSDEQIAAFKNYMRSGTLSWEGLCSGEPRRPRGLCLSLLMPGRTAMLLMPPPTLPSIEPQTQRAVLAAELAKLERHKLHYAQMLLEREDAGRTELAQAAGFRLLAPLAYMERDARYPWVDPPDQGAVGWIPYGPQVEQEFARTLLATYEDSLDCPELMGLRPVEDVLEAHRATGEFDPQLWQLARVGDEAAGCLLLARLALGQVVEVVYVGVTPAHRRQGLGALLLRRALQLARNVRARRVSIVVDERNAPARRLYERFGFATVTQRMAWFYRWNCVKTV